MKKHLLSAIICGALLLPLHQFKAHGDELLTGEDGNGSELTAMHESSELDFITLKIPLFSPLFIDTPVALVDNEPIPLRDLASTFWSQRNQKSGNLQEREKEYLDVLNRLISTRLIVQEAINIGLDETDAMKNQVEDFKQTLLQRELIKNHIRDLKPDPATVDEYYKQMSVETQIYSLTFELAGEAQRFGAEVKDGDFEELAEKYIKEGKAKGGKGEQYIKIKDLLPQIVQVVYFMDKGEVSNIFRGSEGFILFKLLDKRFVEDPDVEKEAADIALATLRKEKAEEYTKALQDKYVTVDKNLYDQLDFTKNFQQLKGDKRVLATVKGDKPVTITISDLISELIGKAFHGVENPQQLKKLDAKKDGVFSDMLFRYTSELEAHHLGLDQNDDYLRKVEAFERSTLFSAFMTKVILPDVKLTSEEVRSYYDEHIDDYSSPAMLRMNSLVFDNRKEAESSFDKLRKGADFKWVSANSVGLVPPDTQGILNFDRNLLSMTALPEDLQHDAENAKKGTPLLYAPSDGDFFYVLHVQDIYPSEAQPYEKVRKEVAKVVFNMKSEKLIAEWVEKLKEAYPVQIYLNNIGT